MICIVRRCLKGVALAAGLGALVCSGPVQAFVTDIGSRASVDAYGPVRPVTVPFFLTSDTMTGVLGSAFMARSHLSDPVAIRAFYKANGDHPAWQGMISGNDNVEPFIAILERSWTQGLNPFIYHIREIHEMDSSNEPASKAQKDILLTDAFVRYVRDMTGMRIDPAAFDLNAADWRARYTAEQALNVLSEPGKVQDFLKNLPPKSHTYHVLQAELESLAAQPKPAYESVLPIHLPPLFRPMMRDRNVPALRARLSVQAQTADIFLYDDALAAAVENFQRESGLKDDGIVGETTLKLLNRSKSAKMLQIIATLERLRWVNEARPEKFALVNIPSATLWAIEQGKIVFEMPVIVGKPELSTQTFITLIRGVRFNPQWTVPTSIIQKEIWPKLRANPHYLADKGMELIRLNGGGGEVIDPAGIDWKTITARDLKRLEMRQIPGAHNPLGRIRILMPNRYDIYLHDTNQPQFFGKAQRAQSHGCIRMSEPMKMAAFVLSDEKGWDEARMQKLIDAGKTRDVAIATPIPVYILYYTVWVDDAGKVTYGNDIYDADPKLIELLNNIKGFYVPGHFEDGKRL